MASEINSEAIRYSLQESILPSVFHKKGEK